MNYYNNLESPSRYDQDSQIIHRVEDLNILPQGDLDLETIIRSNSEKFVKDYKDFFDLNGSSRNEAIRNFWKREKDELEKFFQDFVMTNDFQSEGNDAIQLLQEALDECYINQEEIGRFWDNQEQENHWYSIEELRGAGLIQNDVNQIINVLQRDNWGRMDIDLGFRATVKNNIEKKDRKKVLANFLKREIQNHGKFLEIQGELYFYEREKREIHKIDTQEPVGWHNFLSRRYGLCTSSTNDKYAMKMIEEHGRNIAEETKAHRLFYWDEKNQKLYVSNKGKYYYVLDGENIEKRFNGQNGIYFLESFDVKNPDIDSSVFEYIPPELRDEDFDVPGNLYSDDYSVLEDVLINRTNFEYKTALNEDEQRMQLLNHFYTIPFYSAIETKPIMTFVGEKNSGKSTTLNMLGKFFMKTEYKVSSLPSKEEDFYVATINSLLFFIDNVDKERDQPADWLEDSFAKISTGAEIRKRKLYKDTQEIRVKPDCFIGVTSRSPYFKRDDVVDRMLVFHVERVEEEIDENPLVKPIRENYDELWSIYLERLNKIVSEIQNRGEDYLHQDTNHRLAAWVIFSRIISDALDLNEDVRQAMEDKMRREKAMFTLEDENITGAIDKWLNSLSSTEGEGYKAGELADMWNENDEIDYNDFKPNWVGRKLSKLKDELNTVYNMEREKEDGTYVYSFQPSKSDLNDAEEDKEPKGEETEKTEDEKEQEEEEKQRVSEEPVLTEGNKNRVVELLKDRQKNSSFGLEKDKLIEAVKEDIDLTKKQSEGLIDSMIENEIIFYDDYDNRVRKF